MTPEHVAGSSISAMFVVQSLLDKGQEVIWHIPNGYLKSHFTSLKIDGQHLDLGMVLLEPYVREQLGGGQIGDEPKGSAGLRELAASFDWLQEHGLSMTEIAVRDITDSDIRRDFIISDCLDLLNNLSSETKAKAIFELKQIISDMDNGLIVHPKLKQHLNTPIRGSLGTYLIQSVGQEIAKTFLLPWVEKMGESAGKIPASLHRTVWAPLYYPETILEFLDTGASSLQPMKFSVPNGLAVGEFLDRFFKLLLTRSGLQICICDRTGCSLETISLKSNGLAYAMTAGNELGREKYLVQPETAQDRPVKSSSAVLEYPILTFISNDNLPDEVFFDLRSNSALLRCTTRSLSEQGNFSSISVEANSALAEYTNLELEELVLESLPSFVSEASLVLKDIRMARLSVPQYVEGFEAFDMSEPSLLSKVSFRYFATIGRDFSSLNDQLTMARFATREV